MDQHDKSFMTTFVVILSILILITVVLIFGANLVAKLSVQSDDGVRRSAVANERIKPVAQVFVTGQERPKTAAPAAAPVKVAQVQQTGEQIYTGKCAACHMAGVLGAPKLVKTDWEPRFAQGLDTLVSHAVNGIRSMPAKGGHPDLTEQDIRNSIIHMLKTSGIAVAAEEVTAPAEATPAPPVTAPVVAEVSPPPVATPSPTVQPIETPPPPAVAMAPAVATAPVKSAVPAPTVSTAEPQAPVKVAVSPPASPATATPVSAPSVVTTDASGLATLTAQATAAAAQASAAAASAAAAASQAAAAASQAAAAAAKVAQAVSSAPASTPAPMEEAVPVPPASAVEPPAPEASPAQPAPVPPVKAVEPAPAAAPPAVAPEPPAPKATPPVTTTQVQKTVPPVALTAPAPAPPPTTEAITLPAGLDLVRGQQTYNTACIVCHLSGVAGSPKLGDKAAWQPRLAQGFETLVKHALEGYKGMPARGARMDIPDQEIINAIGYMVTESK